MGVSNREENTGRNRWEFQTGKKTEDGKEQEPIFRSGTEVGKEQVGDSDWEQVT